MNWDLAAWAVGGLCALVATVLGGKRIGGGAQSVTENVDPNQQLLSIVERQGRQIERLTADSDHSKVRMSDMERDLTFEKDRADRHEQQIGSLQEENRDLHRQLDLLQRAVAAWETWHRWLVSKWHELRQSDTPPDGPRVEPVDPT